VVVAWQRRQKTPAGRAPFRGLPVDLATTRAGERGLRSGPPPTACVRACTDPSTHPPRPRPRALPCRWLPACGAAACVTRARELLLRAPAGRPTSLALAPFSARRPPLYILQVRVTSGGLGGVVMSATASIGRPPIPRIVA
jgi:hypothetical protein